MSARGKARKRALDILFEAEIRGEPVLDLLAERSESASPPVPEYAAELVRGVQEHRERIDEMLAEHARGWTLERMPAVDDPDHGLVGQLRRRRLHAVRERRAGCGEVELDVGPDVGAYLRGLHLHEG